MVDLSRLAGEWVYWVYALVLWGEMLTTLLATSWCCPATGRGERLAVPVLGTDFDPDWNLDRGGDRFRQFGLQVLSLVRIFILDSNRFINGEKKYRRGALKDETNLAQIGGKFIF